MSAPRSTRCTPPIATCSTVHASSTAARASACDDQIKRKTENEKQKTKKDLAERFARQVLFHLLFSEIKEFREFSDVLFSLISLNFYTLYCRVSFSIPMIERWKFPLWCRVSFSIPMFCIVILLYLLQ